MDRIAAFEQFIAERPDDPFPVYGLAMEHKNRGDLAAARAVFEQMGRKFPDYVPLYLMFGNTLEDLGEQQEAVKIYRKGIEISRAAGDRHTEQELQAALAQLEESM